MKKILTLMVGMFLLVSLAPNVMAQEEIDENAGITPDSPLWGVERALEQVRYAFTLGDENKVNYGLQIAEERLSEIQKMQENNISTENFAKAEVEREKIMNRTRERARNNETLQNKIRERKRIQERKSTQLRERLPEQAQKGLDTAIRNQRRGTPEQTGRR